MSLHLQSHRSSNCGHILPKNDFPDFSTACGLLGPSPEELFPGAVFASPGKVFLTWSLHQDILKCRHFPASLETVSACKHPSTPPPHVLWCFHIQAYIIIHFISYWLIDFKFLRGSSGLSGRSIEYLISFLKSTRKTPNLLSVGKRSWLPNQLFSFLFPEHNAITSLNLCSCGSLTVLPSLPCLRGYLDSQLCCSSCPWYVYFNHVVHAVK